jgi:hypothetical protein
MKPRPLVKLSVPLFAEIERRIGQRSSPPDSSRMPFATRLRDEARNAVKKLEIEPIDAPSETLNAEPKDMLTGQAPYVSKAFQVFSK